MSRSSWLACSSKGALTNRLSMSIDVGFKVLRSSLFSSMSEQALEARAKGRKMLKPFKERDKTARAQLFVAAQEGAAVGLKKKSRFFEPKALKTALCYQGNPKA